ncbi:MAG: HNH endonuclease [Ignavibacteriales bacterium]|nr:HNH endonuclease [Ignavibacteriales bacterium]
MDELNTITFRYNVISGLHTNEIEVVFNKLAVKIFTGEITTASASFEVLKDIYINDESFSLAFATKEISTNRNKNLVKYILVEMENAISETDNQFEDATSTIEHILPENPGTEWEINFPANEQADYIYLLGNYSLLEANLNKKASDKSFADKSQVYALSKYRMSKVELNYTSWNPVILRQHQDKMAKWACGVWKSKYVQNKF